MSKPKCVKDYKKLSVDIKNMIRAKYPYGFDRNLITFKDHKGKFVSALPFETESIYYLIKITRSQAHKVMTEQNASVEKPKTGSAKTIDMPVPDVRKEMSGGRTGDGQI